MQFTLVNPPQIFARSPSGRIVQIAGRAGDVGRFKNIVVPDEREIKRLKPFIHYLANEKLKPSEPFNYGIGSGYNKRLLQDRPADRPEKYKKPSLTDLPLFEKL